MPPPQVARHNTWLAKYLYINMHGELSYVDVHENDSYHDPSAWPEYPRGDNDDVAGGQDAPP